MIPTPQELIKEALQSGPEGVLGRQHAPGSMGRYDERMRRRKFVSDRMRDAALKQPGGPTKAQREKFIRSSVKSTQDARGFSKALNKSFSGMSDGVAADLKRRQKSSNRKALGIGLGTAALAGGAYALYKRKKAREAALRAPQQGPGAGQPSGN